MPPVVSAPHPRRAIRGAIRALVSTSRDAIIAGDHFSVFVKVQNPFEVPLGILEVSAFVPVEFYDVEQRRQANVALSRQVVGFFGSIGRFLRSFTGPRLGRQLNADTQEVGKVSARGISSSRPSTPGEANPDGLAEGETLLQPGNSTTQAFTLCTRQERNFRPGSYRMQISVRYRFDPEQGPPDALDDNVDVIEYVLDVRASLSSIMLGGTVGSVCGWFAKNLSLLSTLPWSFHNFAAQTAALVVHVLLTWGVLLLFARKKDVQPLLSVEDIYGGALIGFMVGFTGGDAVSSMLQFPAGGGQPT